MDGMNELVKKSYTTHNWSNLKCVLITTTSLNTSLTRDKYTISDKQQEAEVNDRGTTQNTSKKLTKLN